MKKIKIDLSRPRPSLVWRGWKRQHFQLKPLPFHYVSDPAAHLHERPRTCKHGSDHKSKRPASVRNAWCREVMYSWSKAPRVDMEYKWYSRLRTNFISFLISIYDYINRLYLNIFFAHSMILDTHTSARTSLSGTSEISPVETWNISFGLSG